MDLKLRIVRTRFGNKDHLQVNFSVFLTFLFSARSGHSRIYCCIGCVRSGRSDLRSPSGEGVGILIVARLGGCTCIEGCSALLDGGLRQLCAVLIVPGDRVIICLCRIHRSDREIQVDFPVVILPGNLCRSCGDCSEICSDLVSKVIAVEFQFIRLSVFRVDRVVKYQVIPGHGDGKELIQRLSPILFKLYIIRFRSNLLDQEFLDLQLIALLQPHFLVLEHLEGSFYPSSVFQLYNHTVAKFNLAG